MRKFTIEYEPALREYLREKGLSKIVVEVISSQNSDFEVTELYVHAIRDSQADYMKDKKNYRAVQAPVGELLLPPYILEYDETVTFGLKKRLFFRSIFQNGIRL